MNDVEEELLGIGMDIQRVREAGEQGGFGCVYIVIFGFLGIVLFSLLKQWLGF